MMADRMTLEYAQEVVQRGYGLTGEGPGYRECRAFLDGHNSMKEKVDKLLEAAKELISNKHYVPRDLSVIMVQIYFCEELEKAIQQFEESK